MIRRFLVKVIAWVLIVVNAVYGTLGDLFCEGLDEAKRIADKIKEEGGEI